MIKKNKKSINTISEIANKIPYKSVYEEEGMIETSEGVFTKTYFIEDVDPNNVKNFNQNAVTNAYRQLLNELPNDMSMQFIIHNRLIQQDVFLEKVIQIPNKEDKVNHWINAYNETVSYNSMVGHNNVKKNKYFTLSVKADNADDAALRFKNIDNKVKALFHNICGINVGGLTTVSRLKIIYSMFNPKSNEFGKKADLRGDGNFNFENMKKLKLTTKDCVAPETLYTKEKSYIVLNDNTYVRSFFIASMPANISQNLFSDITNISSNMILSAIYEPMDSEYGYEIASQKIVENTLVKEAYKRDTISDRRNKIVIKTETMIKQNEDSYFEKEALNLMKEAVAVQEKTMLSSFVIVLYADDLDSLERDTKLLHLSTSKFACQVKPLDLQQINGFQTALPLCQNKVDVKRTFNISKLATVSPLNIQEVMQKDGLYYGLNTVNDNLVLLNRKNNPNLAGIIAGTEHSGKTFQNKREILNALISTNDTVMIVANGSEYDRFVKELDGVIIDKPFNINPFAISKHYGFLHDDLYSKSIMLEAYLESLVRQKEQVFLTIEQKLSLEEDDEEDTIGNEISFLLNSELDLNNFEAVCDFIYDNQNSLPLLYSRLDAIKSHFLNRNDEPNIKNGRLFLFKTDDLTEKILLMDYLWQVQMKLKMENNSSWVFLDSVDNLLSSEQGSSFIKDMILKMNAMKNVLTMVIQNSVKLFTDSYMGYRLEELVSIVGYHKLLNQGAIERKRYSDILNIPNTLSNYITAAELGKGIILTSASNIPFDDSFYEEEKEDEEAKGSAFYSLFKM